MGGERVEYLSGCKFFLIPELFTTEGGDDDPPPIWNLWPDGIALSTDMT
jgi:hypothetical protein